jgi:hypothetical protein
VYRQKFKNSFARVSHYHCSELCHVVCRIFYVTSEQENLCGFFKIILVVIREKLKDNHLECFVDCWRVLVIYIDLLTEEFNLSVVTNVHNNNYY